LGVLFQGSPGWGMPGLESITFWRPLFCRPFGDESAVRRRLFRRPRPFLTSTSGLLQAAPDSPGVGLEIRGGCTGGWRSGLHRGGKVPANSFWVNVSDRQEGVNRHGGRIAGGREAQDAFAATGKPAVTGGQQGHRAERCVQREWSQNKRDGRPDRPAAI